MSPGPDQYIFLENLEKKISVGPALWGEHVGARVAAMRRLLSTQKLMSVPCPWLELASAHEVG